MIKIKPVQFPLGKGAATKLLVQANSFSSQATTTDLYYGLYSNEGKLISDGTIALTEEQYAAWGADNTYIEDIVINQLALTRD